MCVCVCVCVFVSISVGVSLQQIGNIYLDNILKGKHISSDAALNPQSILAALPVAVQSPTERRKP